MASLLWGPAVLAAVEPTLVADIGDNSYASTPGDSRAELRYMVAHDGKVYWGEYSKATALAIWCSDHGAAPSKLMEKFDGSIEQMNVFGGTIYITLFLDYGRPGKNETNLKWFQLWKTKGTPATTEMVYPQ